MATRQQNLLDPESCLNRAAPDEPIFVLRGHDVAAAQTVRDWAHRRVVVGKSSDNSPEIIEAMKLADEMDRWRTERPLEQIARTTSAPGFSDG